MRACPDRDVPKKRGRKLPQSRQILNMKLQKIVSGGWKSVTKALFVAEFQISYWDGGDMKSRLSAPAFSCDLKLTGQVVYEGTNRKMPKASPNDVSMFDAEKSTFVGFHRNQGKVAFAGPLFPFGSGATAKDSFQVGAIGRCQAKLGEKALGKVRLQSCDREPAVAGLIERIERIAAAKR